MNWPRLRARPFFTVGSVEPPIKGNVSSPTHVRLRTRLSEPYPSLWQTLSMAMQVPPHAFPVLQFGCFTTTTATGHLMNLPPASRQGAAVAAEPKARTAAAARMKLRMKSLPFFSVITLAQPLASDKREAVPL
jgi:hypothetical protein